MEEQAHGHLDYGFEPDSEEKLALRQLDEQIATASSTVASLRSLVDNPPAPVIQRSDNRHTQVRVSGTDLSQARRSPIVADGLRTAQRSPRPEGGRQAEAGDLREQVAASSAGQWFVGHRHWFTAGGGGLIVLAVMVVVMSGSRAAAQTSSPPPTTVVAEVRTVTLTPAPTSTPEVLPTATPPHAGLPAPGRIQAVQIKLDLQILPARWTDVRGGCVAPAPADQSTATPAPCRAVYPPPDDPADPSAGKYVYHTGGYPGETTNIVILGGWRGFGEQLQNLQLNDWITVLDRNGNNYIYLLLPCEADGSKECVVGKADEELRGDTPQQTLTLIASRNSSNYVLRAKFLKKVPAQPGLPFTKP